MRARGVRAGHMASLAAIAALSFALLTRAYIQLPLGSPDALINNPTLARRIASVTTLSNGLSSLIRTPPSERSQLLGVNITDDWASDPYKIRLLADAVESYIFLYTPAFIVAVGRNWPLGPSFIHSQGLSTPAQRTTAPNWDTVYSAGRAELNLGPFELRVPPLKDRFYSVVLYDAYQNVIVSLGNSQHITDGISLLLVGPSSPREPVEGYKLWQQGLGPKTLGAVPYTEIVEFPTDIALVLLRVLLLNPSQTVDPVVELPAIQAFQAGVSLKPYKTKVDPTVTFPRFPGGPPAVQDVAVDPATFYNWATSVVAQYPAPPSTLSSPLSGKLKRLGLLDSSFNFSASSADVQQALKWAIPIGNRLIDGGILSGFEYEYNTWQVSTRNWGVYGSDSFTNAVVAKAYYIPNTGIDAVYAVSFWDASGTPFDGTNGNRYTWTIKGGVLPYDAKLGWWAFIVYDKFNTLIENPLKRYGVGDRTKGFVYANGTNDLTLYLQADPPADPVEYANWVPTGSGPFSAVLRLYVPTLDFIDGKTILEPILSRGPAPTTAAATTVPATTAPATTAPATVAPTTTVPTTAAPSTWAPSTAAPATTVPATSAPTNSTSSGGGR